MRLTGIYSAGLLATLLSTATTVEAARDRRAQAGDSARYVCSDARAIEVLYGGGVAVVTIDGNTVQMQRSPGADTEIYVGHGWQWVSTGKRTGSLTRLDGGKPGLSCRAP